MKINKLAAVGATFALAVGSVFGASIAANAIEVPVGSIGVEGDSYPTGTWFLGDPVGPELTQDATGLTIPGQNQLLYGQSTAGITGAAFADFVEGASFDGDGDLTFQIPVYFDGENATDFTTLRPAVTGSPSTGTDWVSSRSVAGLTANTPVPFSEIVAAFGEGDGAEILAFGVFVNPDQTALLRSVTSGGVTWTFATPTVAPVVPVPVQGPATFTG